MTTTQTKKVDFSDFDLNRRYIKHMLYSFEDIIEDVEEGNMDVLEALKAFNYVDEQIANMTEEDRAIFMEDWGAYISGCDFLGFSSFETLKEMLKSME